MEEGTIRITEVPQERRKRPAENPRWAAVKYWNSGDTAVAIIAIYGGRCVYRCRVCDQTEHIFCGDALRPEAGEFKTKHLLCIQEGGLQYVEISGDWAAYIGATTDVEFSEDAAWKVQRCGEKLDKDLAEAIFPQLNRQGMVYRR